MLTSIALIFILGLCMGGIFKRLNLPPLIGMIIVGIIMSPYALNLLDESLLNIAKDLRQIALVIILTRAGLSLNIEALKKVGRPAILMCFLPACFEILGMVLIATTVMGMSINEALIIGAVVSAVSPAVIVPRMIKIDSEGYGNKHSVPQLILAGASVDDVFVIVLFSAFLSLETNGTISAMDFLRIPVSIIVGIIIGVLIGLLLTQFFKRVHIRDSVKLLIMISISFLILELQSRLENIVPISGLLAIMSMSIAINQRHKVVAKRLSEKYNKLWVGAEVVLFVLVGATVNLNYVANSGLLAGVIIISALLFRIVGVLICLIKTKFTKSERIFCMLAYTPKATVQAGIGAIPLSMGLACGDIVLTFAVLSILITAPIGAICIDKLYKKLLNKD